MGKTRRQLRKQQKADKKVQHNSDQAEKLQRKQQSKLDEAEFVLKLIYSYIDNGDFKQGIPKSIATWMPEKERAFIDTRSFEQQMLLLEKVQEQMKTVCEQYRHGISDVDKLKLVASSA